jgi:Sulfatase-modifying factor enzyme 1
VNELDTAKVQNETGKLMTRIKNNSNIHRFARNPLLLGMIVNVHHRGQLPENCVELYEEIFKVYLRVLWQGSLTEPVFLKLQGLAYEMTLQEKEEIEENYAVRFILEHSKILIEPKEILNGLEKVGLWIQKSSKYGFAHRSLREYLTALYVKNNGQTAILEQQVGSNWWRNTIVLYCAAQADPTPIINACLEGDRLSSKAVGLALHLYRVLMKQNAMKQKGTPEVLERFNKAVINAIEKDVEGKQRAADALLDQRKEWISFNDDAPVGPILDPEFICCLEYQLFLDQKESTCQPDDWEDRRFPEDQAMEPILGVRYSDADKFCNWLNEREKETGFHYRLPTYQEIQEECGITMGKTDRGSWLSDYERFERVKNGPIPLSKEEVEGRLEKDKNQVQNDRHIDKTGSDSYLHLDEGIPLADILTRAPDDHKELLKCLQSINVRLSSRDEKLRTDYRNAHDERIEREKPRNEVNERIVKINAEINRVANLETQLERDRQQETKLREDWKSVTQKIGRASEDIRDKRDELGDLQFQPDGPQRIQQLNRLRNDIDKLEKDKQNLEITRSNLQKDEQNSESDYLKVREAVIYLQNQFSEGSKKVPKLHERLKELSELEEKVRNATAKEEEREKSYKEFHKYAGNFDEIYKDFSIFKSTYDNNLLDALVHNRYLDLDRILLVRNNDPFDTPGNVCISLNNYIKYRIERLKECYRNADRDIKSDIGLAVNLAGKLEENTKVEHVQKIHKILTDYLDKLNENRSHIRSDNIRLYIRYFANVLAKHLSFWMQNELFPQTRSPLQLQSIPQPIIKTYFDMLIAFTLLEKRIEKRKEGGVLSASEGILVVREGRRRTIDS